MNPSETNKICLITGGTNGFGFEAAKELARQGMHLVLVGRDQERTKAVQQKITAETGHAPDILIGDLLYQKQVKRIAAEFRAKYDRLDVLINNAGFAFTPRQETDEGFEKTFALNYLAYFTLTLELIDLLIASAPARIINTTSEAHRWRDISFDNLQGEKEFPSGQFAMPLMYGWSNMQRIMLTYELADRLQKVGVTANTFCPGFVAVRRTAMPWYFNMIASILSILPRARSPKEASKIITFLATSPEAAEQTGLYYSSGQLTKSAEQSYDKETRQQLWATTLQMVGYQQDPLTMALTQNT